MSKLNLHRLSRSATTRVRCGCALLLWSLLWNSTISLGAQPPLAKADLRRPIAVVLSADEKQAYVANQRTGSISIIDLAKKAVIGETRIGGRPSDLVRRPASRQWLVADEQRHQLLLVERTLDGFVVLQRLPVSPYPVGIVVSRDGKTCFVASFWSRRISKIALPQNDGEQAKVVQVLDVDIAPRKQILIEKQHRLIAADSFGGKLVVIDTRNMKSKGTRVFPAHNIRGLAVNQRGDMLVIAHQMLNELAHTVRNDVHWGLLMSNDLRWMRLNAVLEGSTDLYAGAHMHPLGEAGSAMGDPSSVVMANDGKVIVTLGGVGEVAIGQERDFSLRRVTVGKRPTAVVVNRTSDRAVVVNTFGESLSVIDLNQREALAEIALSSQASLSEIDRGEMLFYDARFSHDSWMSCNSCHTDGHTNGMLNDNFSDGSFGAPKRVLSLLGRHGTKPFAWNASAASLEEQIRKSIENTMQSDSEPTDRQVSLIAAFVNSLKPPPSLDAVRGVRDDQAVVRGRQVFAAQQCNRCHEPPSYTTPKTYQVDLEDELGTQRFNPPSLRGVGQRGPYFHDNRARDLRAVLSDHGHPLKQPLEGAEMRDLIAFLRSL